MDSNQGPSNQGTGNVRIPFKSKLANTNFLFRQMASIAPGGGKGKDKEKQKGKERKRNEADVGAASNNGAPGGAAGGVGGNTSFNYRGFPPTNPPPPLPPLASAVNRPAMLGPLPRISIQPPTDNYNTVTEAHRDSSASHRGNAYGPKSTQQSSSTRNSATPSAVLAAEAHPIKSCIGPWQLGVDVGHGGSCLVRVVRHQSTHQKAVAKIVNVATADRVRARSLANLCEVISREDEAANAHASSRRDSARVNLPIGLEREATILRVLDHPNVCKLYDVWQHYNEVYLILEYVEGGELFSYITQTNAQRGRKERSLQMDELEAICVFRQILAGVLYCHRLNICHRDLKPENILYNPVNKTIKLIDYGMAAFQPEGTKLSTPCGSPHYAAPELLHGKMYDGAKADVWSAGVILYALLLGDLPFNFPSTCTTKDDQIHALYNKIKRADYNIPSGVAPEIKDLFRKIFQPEPQRRIDMKTLWHHKYLHKYDEPLGWEGLGIDDFVGPMPSLSHWTPLTPATIDPSILRSLSTLWHSTHRSALIQQLCSPIANIEKYFYQALVKSYNDALENLDILFYRGGLVRSPSDYHHINLPAHLREQRFDMFAQKKQLLLQQQEVKRLLKQDDQEQMRLYEEMLANQLNGKAQAESSHAAKANNVDDSSLSHRSNSRFSVYKSEHLTSQHSFFNDGDDDDVPIAQLQDRANYWKRRQQEIRAALDNGHGSVGSGTANLHSQQLRLAALAKAHPNLGPEIRRSSGRLSVTSNHSRTGSRASRTSSITSGHTKRGHHHVVASSRHKPKISFEHKNYRQHSRTSSSLQRQRQEIPRADSSCLPTAVINSSPMGPHGSPLLLQVPNSGNTLHVPKKRSATIATPAAAARPASSTKPQYLIHAAPETPATVLKRFDVEARKVSSELAQVCHAAFFSSSSATTASADDPSEIDTSLLNNSTMRTLDTPPSSVSKSSSAAARHGGALNELTNSSNAKVNRVPPERPLPMVPSRCASTNATTPNENTSSPVGRSFTGSLASRGDTTEMSHFTRQIADIKQQLTQNYVQTDKIGEIQRHMEEIIEKLDLSIPRDSWTDRLGGTAVHNYLGLGMGNNALLQVIPEETKGSFSNRGSHDESAAAVKQSDSALADDSMSLSVLGYQNGGAKRTTTIRYVAPSSPVTPSSIAPLNVRKPFSAAAASTAKAAPSGSMSPASDTEATVSSLRSKGVARKKSTLQHMSFSRRRVFWRRFSNQARRSMVLAKRASLLGPPAAASNKAGANFSSLDDRVTRRDERKKHPLHQQLNVDQPQYQADASPSALFNNSDTILVSTPTRQRSSRAIHHQPYLQGREQMQGQFHHASMYDDSHERSDNYTTALGADAEPTMASYAGVIAKSKLGKLFARRAKVEQPFGIDNVPPESAYDPSAGPMMNMVATMPPALQNGYQIPLLNRILRLRPASYVMVFEKNRKHVRQLIVSVLRLDNNRRNICDLAMHPRNINYMTARLDEGNEWGFKPVWLALEFFNILRDGHQANITAFRLTQIRGSAGSVQKLGDHFAARWARNMLLADASEARQIIRLVQTGRMDSQTGH